MNFARGLPGASLILVLTAVAGLAIADTGDGGSPRELSLAMAVQTALEHSPMLKQISAGSDLAAAMVEEARGGKLPYVEASTSFMRSNNPVFVFGSLLEQEKFTADRFNIDKLNNPTAVNNNRTTINAMVPIFDGFQTDIRVARANLGAEGASKRKELAEQALRLEVIRAYYGTILAEERAKVARDAVKTAEADVKRIRDMSEVGMLVRSDLLAVEVQLAEFKQGVIEAETEAEVARVGLNSLMGLSETERANLTGTLTEKAFELPERGEVAAAALKNRQELTLNDLNISSAEESVRGAKNTYLPRVDLLGVYGASSETIGADSTDWMFGVKVTMPIFDPGRTSRISQAMASEVGARAGKKVDEDRIALESISAHKRFTATREKLAVAASAVSQAEEAHRIVQDRYEVGLTTVTEVLRAENALLRAKLGELMARYYVYVGYADFLRATGNLRSVDAFSTTN